MKLIRKAGVTAEIWQLFIQDSSSTTGAGLTGLTQASSGLTAYYHRDTDTTATAITLVTMTVGTFTSSGFKEIDATNMPGWYQFCPPNAALAAGAKSCGIHLKGATNMAPLPIEVQLVAFDPEDAVRLGLTALPNAAAEAAGGLYTRGTGAGQIQQEDNGQVSINVKAWLRTTVSTPTVAGVPNVNTKTWNDLATVALPLVPTAAGRTLDVSAAGNAGIDWANIDAPTTTQGLSGTTIKAVTDAPADSAGVTTLLSRLTALRAGYLDNLSAGAVALEASLQGLITTVGVAGAGLTAVTTQVWAAGTRTLTSFGTLVADVTTAVWAAATRTLTGTQTFDLTGNITGNLSGSVGSVTGDIGGLAAGAQSDVRDAIGMVAANLDTQLSALATLINGTATPAQVASAIATALATTTYAEPTGVPGNTVSIQEKLGRIYQVLIDGLVVDSGSGELQFKNAAGTVLWKKTFTDVANVYTESAKTAP